MPATMDAASLLGGMLSSSFGRRSSSSDGPGIGTIVAGAAGAAAVGGLGYLAYQHFAGRPQQGSMGPGMQQGMQGMQQGGFGAPPGQGFPGGPMNAVAQGPGGMLSGIMGGSNDLQRGGFSVPGYEWQAGAGGGAGAQGGTPPSQAPQMPVQQTWGTPVAGQPGQQGWGSGPVQAPQTAPQGWGTPPGQPQQGQPQQGWTADQYKALPERPVSPYADAGAVPTADPKATATANTTTTTNTTTTATTNTTTEATGPSTTTTAATTTPGGSVDFPSGPVEVPTAEQQGHAMLLVRAMVAAASADGQIDEEERRTILERLASSGATAAEIAALEAEMKAPQQVTVLASQVSSPELAEQFYAVSLLGMKIDTDAEKGYVRMLPLLLRLSDDAARAVEAKVGVSVPR